MFLLFLFFFLGGGGAPPGLIRRSDELCSNLSGNVCGSAFLLSASSAFQDRHKWKSESFSFTHASV